MKFHKQNVMPLILPFFWHEGEEAWLLQLVADDHAHCRAVEPRDVDRALIGAGPEEETAVRVNGHVRGFKGRLSTRVGDEGPLLQRK